MASILHLLGSNDSERASPIIAEQVAAGDAVTVAIVGPTKPSLPPGVAVHRVPEGLSWDQLLDLIFASDHVFSW